MGAFPLLGLETLDFWATMASIAMRRPLNFLLDPTLIRFRQSFPEIAGSQDNFISETFSGRPRFHALSYIWGDPNETTSIYCNEAYVKVTTNLYDALRDMFTQFPDRLLWVDALCINQNDLVEKAMQMALMGDIYHGAESVMI